MSTVVRLAARNTMRRRARTALTAGMVVFGVAMLLIALTWIRGIFGSMTIAAADSSGHVRLVDRDFAEREELLPLDEHVGDVARWQALLLEQPGVIAVEPRIITGATVTVGEEIGDVYGAAIGASERYFRERLRLKEKLSSGAWFSGAPDEVVIGAKIAAQAEARPGDEMVLLGMTQDGSLSSVKARIAGVVRTGGMLDQQVFLPLERLQYFTDIGGGATELLIYGRAHEDAPALAAQLNAMPDFRGFLLESFTEREPWKSAGSSVRRTQSIIIFVIVFLTALGIWNTMMMSVLERTHEVGVLRAMGLSRLGTIALFVGEALAIAVAGGIIGLLLGAYPAWLLETKGINIGEQTAAASTAAISDVIRGDLSVESAVIVFALGLLTAVLGSLVPALRAAAIQPVSAMRSGR
jgi:putative ABC transport system permease protein